MCIVIWRPATAIIPEANLIACGTKNRDGWGIMFVDDGEVRTLRSMKLEDFLPTYRKLAGRELGIHFRIRTNGKTDLANTHPFRVLRKHKDGQDLWLMHNGVIRMNEINKDMSDTWHYIQGYLRPILKTNPELLHNKAFAGMIEDHIGTGSKFLTLDDKGRFVVINEKAGSTLFGCWFSNSYSHHLPYNAGGSPSNSGAGFRNGEHVWNDDDYYGYYGRGFRRPGPYGHSTVVGDIVRSGIPGQTSPWTAHAGRNAAATVAAAKALHRRSQQAGVSDRVVTIAVGAGNSSRASIGIGGGPVSSSPLSTSALPAITVSASASSAAANDKPAEAEAVGAANDGVETDVSASNALTIREPEPNAMAAALFEKQAADRDEEGTADDDEEEEREERDDTIYDDSVAAMLMDATKKDAHELDLDDLKLLSLTEIKDLCLDNPQVVVWILHNELTMLEQLGR